MTLVCIDEMTFRSLEVVGWKKKQEEGKVDSDGLKWWCDGGWKVLFFCLFIISIFYLFIHLLINLSIHLFIYFISSLTNCFIYSFIYFFMYLFIYFFTYFFYFYFLFFSTQDLLDTVGIHPTIAEEFTLLTTKKVSGANLAKSSCWG